MSDQRLKIAVFIDFDNVEIGVKTTLGLQFDVGAVLEAIKERGEIITKVAYGDWKRAGDHGRAMAQHAVRLVQRVMTPGGDKNGADINLALDALEMAFTHDHINAFVIVGGDSDFITLVEKLKQYDKKVFVVGGRAFTSQVMQKNCTEFVAYENVAGKGGGGVRVDRGRSGGGYASQSLDQGLPLVKRALKVLVDREVSPQLGLLKSTLLQLDSSFSERDYGASTFRDFAEKLEKRGLVSLKHSGRTTLVELAEGVSLDVAPTEAVAAPFSSGGAPASAPARTDGDQAGEPVQRADTDTEPVTDLTLADGVALVRQVLAETTTPPRWPMYLRQMKQFLRNARPDFDERRYGSLQDLLRACQKAGIVRLERDRQGGLRAFAGTVRPSYVPQGWAATETDVTSEAQEAAPGVEPVDAIVVSEGDAAQTLPALESPAAEAEAPVYAASSDVPTQDAPVDVEPRRSAEDSDEGDDQLAMFGVVRPTDPEPAKARRQAVKRGRKTADGDGGGRARRPRKPAATRTGSRRSRS
jgi:uncharacterized LabA/DUF88 family protein